MPGMRASHSVPLWASQRRRLLRNLTVSLNSYVETVLGLRLILSGTASPAPTGGSAIPRTVPLLTLLHTFSALHAYTHGSSLSELGVGFFPPAVIISGGLAVFGLWCVIFGGDPARISKRTGKDKHATSWPFGESQKRKEKKER